ncbi:MAG: HAD family phosphatase [Coleofasciculaceae cyanobacterium RL_1_1]|nr:HAD family phosphatase [Coleofasciculaceae cyanobacterium RL_1_1]
MLQAILFDLDGTLTHSDRIHFSIWQTLLSDHELFIDLDFYKYHISGNTNVTILRDVLPHLSPNEALQFAQNKERLFREMVNLERLPGLDRLLAWCRSRHIRRGVVTNAPRANAEHMLKTLGLMTDHDREFETVVLAEDLPRGKPDPDPYLEGLRRLEIAPEATIAFEDTPTGVRSAVGAKLRTIGVRTTYGEAELAAAGATLTIQDFDDPVLWSWLQANFVRSASF